MANYYPLIGKAVAGLEKNTGEARRILYERARNALVTQLRSVTPPLSESDITRERLALEEAIRKIEADAARRARTGNLQTRSDRPPGEAAPGRPGEAAAAPTSTAAEVGSPASADGGETKAPDAAQERSAAAPAEPAVEGEGQPAPSRRPPPQPAPPKREFQQPRGFGARPPLSRDNEKGEPPPAREPGKPEPPPGRRAAPWPAGLAEPSLSARREAEPGSRSGDDTDDFAFAPRDRGGPPSSDRDDEETAQEQPFPARVDETEEQPSAFAEGLVSVPALASNRLVWIAAAAVLIVFGLSGLVYWQWPTIAGLFRGQDTVATPAAPGTGPSSRAKITDRLGAPAAPTTRPQEGPAVAQRVVLYEEDPSNPAGKRFVGTAVWRTESVAAGPGQALDVAVRAEIEIPEPKVTVKWSLRRNTDKALPASHTIEIMFAMPADTPNGGISNIPGILMKQAEQTRGVPLAGLAVKVTAGFFLIGLSSAEADIQRNIQLLKERGWFDVPVVYANGRRAILAIEKGAPGDRAFADAFAAWGE
ncbi:MAG: hypothetical protein ACXWU5_04525 [Rhodoplanes sp.]